MSKHANYYDEWKTTQYKCDRCGWVGEGGALTTDEWYWEFLELHCPECGETVLLVSFPTSEEVRANWEKLDDSERRSVERREQFLERVEREKLRSVDDLPDVSTDTFILSWDFAGDEGVDSRTLIKLGDQVLFSEPAVWEGYERFAEVARILKAKYGSRLKDVVPTKRSFMYLYGDRSPSWGFIDQIRRELFPQASS